MPQSIQSELRDAERTAMLLVPGFGPDVLPVQVLGKRLTEHGFAVTVTNFWGDRRVTAFARLSMQDCVADLADIIARLHRQYARVIGVGISLGGALLMEYAKTGSGLSQIVSIGTPLKLKHRWIFASIVRTMPVLAPFWDILARIRRLRIPPMRSAPTVMAYLEGDFLRHLEHINTPLLLLHSQKDFITDCDTVEQFSKKFAAHHAVLFEDGDHVLDYHIDRITGAILAHLP